MDETQQVIVTQFGAAVGEAVTSPGLKSKMPFVQTALFFDKRLMERDGAANRVPEAEQVCARISDDG